MNRAPNQPTSSSVVLLETWVMPPPLFRRCRWCNMLRMPPSKDTSTSLTVGVTLWESTMLKW